jgi:FO synthase
VLSIARAGAEAGCTEALFTLGDRPEARYRVAREELAAFGSRTTVEYLARCARHVLDETGLLPHLNPGVMTRDELASLRPVAASMGIMLETTAERLAVRGGPHWASPDKVPARRLETIRLAGELSIPFTSGILVGIGETREERIDALLALRSLAAQHGHLREVIVQNFRAKPETRMAGHPDASMEEHLWSIAVARIVLGPYVHVQAPPNLAYEDFPLLLDAGIDDWGGVSPVTLDHVNPEAPWPDVERLAAACRSRGLELVPRLPLYPEHVAELDRWADPAVAPAIRRASDAHGLAREDRWAPGAPVPVPFVVGRDPAPLGLTGDELGEDELVRLFATRGAERERVFASADRLRRETCGDEVTYVVTRNVQYTNVCYFRCGFCAFSKGKLAANLRGPAYLVPEEEIVRRVREAWERGATEVCLQGGIHPAFTGDYYAEVVTAIRDAVPGIHVHAFSALEVWQGAATLGLDLETYLARLRDLGLGSLPGTAAEILDDEVRAVICPDKVTTEQWLDVHETAHRVGLRSNVTIMFGHVERPVHWARHLLRAREQQARSGGFTELVPLPFVPMEAPIFLAGRARRGPTFAEALLLHAVARLALHPLITNVQASWVKLGPEGVRQALAAGVNDLGGTLMNESISRAAGSEWGQELPPERMEELIRSAGRVPRQRTTTYGTPPDEQVRRSFGAPPLAEPLNPPVRDAALRRPSRLLRPAALATPAR